MVREPREGEVLVRSLVSGISVGTEMNVYRGTAPQWRMRRDPATGLFAPSDEPDWTYPLAYGYANAGRVEALGEGVEGFAEGDAVFTYSPHQTYSTVTAEAVVPLGALRDPRHGVFVANLNTALNKIWTRGSHLVRPLWFRGSVLSGSWLHNWRGAEVQT